MRVDLFSEMYRLEATYWWHVAKRRVVLALLAPYLKGPKEQKLFLDAGCGTGMMLKKLSFFGRAIGIDESYKALSFCKKRGFRNVVIVDLNMTLPLKSSSADFVTMLDVLEHIGRDDSLLREIFRILKPGGLFVLTTPAYPAFWTYWDEILGHKRRYRRSALSNKLHRAGFSLIRRSYFYIYLLPIAVVLRIAKTILGERFQNKSDFIALPSWINKILLLFSSIETEVVKRISLPTGLSIICLCEKR